MRDLDETRRVAYMLIASGYTDRHEAVGTFVNAIAHHGSGADADEAMTHAIILATPGLSEDHRSESYAWVKSHISRITGLLSLSAF